VDIDKYLDKIPYEKLYPIPSWQRMVAVVGLALLLAAGNYFVVIKSKDRQIDQLNENLAKIKKEIEDNKVHTRDFSKLKDRLADLDGQLKQASMQLPSQKEIPELLEQISNIGTQFGLEFLKFKPSPEVVKDFYSEVPVRLKIVGKFHNILMFFDEIAHLPRIVTISDIVMKSGTKKTGVTNLKMECNAITYRFIEDAERKKRSESKNGGNKRKRK